MSHRVAAIDCGTNSFRLLVAEPGADGGLVELTRELRIVRLGEGVDATGELHPEALARTFTAAEDYADQLRAYGVPPERRRLVATSAARGKTVTPATARARSGAEMVPAARVRLNAMTASTSQVALAVNTPDGRCASAAPLRSAWTCSMTAWWRWS